MGDEQVWIAYFEAESITRKGYEFPPKAIVKASAPYDARHPDYAQHPMVRVLLSLRRSVGASPILELRGAPDVVENLAAAVEFNWAQIKRQTIAMPKGFTAGY